MAIRLGRVMHVIFVVLALGGILMGGLLSIPTTAALSSLFERRFLPSQHAEGRSSSLQAFVNTVSDGDRNTLVGIYVNNVMALPVGQQPDGNFGYVTREPDHLTQFGLARQYGTLGILAHNDLAGAHFNEIKVNSSIAAVYGDGHIEYYTVNDIQKYQALEPTSAFSNFVNLANPTEQLSAGDLFNRIYARGKRLVLQTCIAENNDPSWGRMFIIASPEASEAGSFISQALRMPEFSVPAWAGD
jgi:hypothetical protein